MITDDPSEEDMEGARSNVVWALNHFHKGNLTLTATTNRMMALIEGAYRQGQRHKPGMCDLCSQQPGKHIICSGCKEPMHYIMNCIQSSGKWYHDLDCMSLDLRRSSTM